MKIRNGFVSNSSTSSFCLFGAYIEEDEAIRVAKLLDSKFDANNVCEAGELIGTKLKLAYSNGPDGDYGLYIGRSPESLKDDETGAQFKQSVKTILAQYFPEVEYGWYTEGWYNG